MGEAQSVASEFARYIAARVPRSTPWTLVYDEMCRVVRARAFRGMGYAELSEAGVSLSIMGLDQTCELLDEAWKQIDALPGSGAD